MIPNLKLGWILAGLLIFVVSAAAEVRVIDVARLDVDADGHIDTIVVMDSNDDDRADAFVVDITNDGHPDLAGILTDVDNDGRTDDWRVFDVEGTLIFTLVDTHNDGHLDCFYAKRDELGAVDSR